MAAADYRLMTEATGQRIAAALEALHLATVTGVKGDAEQNYRHGDVNLTPANIGAVAKSGDTMTGALSVPSIDIDDSWPTIYLRSNSSGTFQTVGAIQATPTGQLSLLEYKNGSLSDVYSLPAPTNDARVGYDILTGKSTVTIPQGGTGMTDAEIFTQYTSNIVADARTRILRWGKIYIAHIAGYCGTTITADVTPMLSLTDSNCAPSQEVYAVFSILGNEPFCAYINSSGNLYSGKTLEQGTWIYGEIMWFARK